MYLLLCHSFVPHARTSRHFSRRPSYPDTRPYCRRTERCPTCSNPQRWICRFYYRIRSRRHRRRSSRPGRLYPTARTLRTGPPWCGPRPVFVHPRPSAATSLEHGLPASPCSCSLTWASVCCLSKRGKIATCDLWLSVDYRPSYSKIIRASIVHCTYWIVPPRRLLHLKIESNVINKLRSLNLI